MRARTLFADISMPRLVPGTLWAPHKHPLVQVAPSASKFQDLKIFEFGATYFVLGR